MNLGGKKNAKNNDLMCVEQHPFGEKENQRGFTYIRPGSTNACLRSYLTYPQVQAMMLYTGFLWIEIVWT